MKKDNLYGLFGLLTLSLVFILVVRFAYPGTIIDPYKGERVDGDLSGMPLHIDEWQHIAQGKYIAEHGLGKNPYTLENHQERQWGFHLFLAFLVLLGGNLVALYPYFAVLCFVLNTFLVYTIAKQWTHKEWVGLCAGFLFVLLPSNANILGNWFFVPFTFSLTFFLISMHMFLDVAVNVRQKKILVRKNIIFVLCAFLLLFMYPLSAVMLFLLAVMYFVLEQKSIVNNKKFFVISALIVLVVMFGLLVHLLGTSWSLSELSGTILFFSHWEDMPYHNMFFLVFGIPSTILFILGCVSLFKERKQFYAKLLLGAVIIFIVESLLYYLFHVSLLMPYVRLLYYFMVVAVVICALSIQNVFCLKKSSYRLYLILIMILLLMSFWKPFAVTPERFSLHKIVSHEDMQLIDYLKTQEQGIVLANPFLSNAITPLSGNKVVAMIPANLPSPQSPYEVFLLAGCESKKDLAQRYAFVYVVSEQYFVCPEFEQKFVTENKILYEYLSA